MNRKDVAAIYNLPAEVRYCTNCTISNQRPRITFDDDGVCSACKYAVYKRQVDWAERERELRDLLDRHRRDDGGYDVIVPVSGGKDGGFVAHQLKNEYGMNPLTVTWSPNAATDVGRRNLDAFIDSGFDHILGTPNGMVNRKLTRLSFIDVGDPFQSFIYGQTNFPLTVAVHYGVPLIMYGENGEVEYGGDMKNAYKPTRDIADHDRHYFSNIPPEYWKEHGLTVTDVRPFMAPSIDAILKNKTEIHFLGYYKFWDPQENYYYCSEHTGFRPNPERSEGTATKYASLDDKLDGFHYYLSYIKFGIGRTTSDGAHEIRDGKISRDEGIALVRRFDGEFPKKHFRFFLEFCDIDEDGFWEVVDCWRADHIWTKSHNEWKLRKPIWEEDGSRQITA